MAKETFFTEPARPLDTPEDNALSDDQELGIPPVDMARIDQVYR